jgi:hypothetical protein
MDYKVLKAVFRIRIRIHVFFGLPDPDPLIRGMDPDPDPFIIMQNVMDPEHCLKGFYVLRFFIAWRSSVRYLILWSLLSFVFIFCFV